MPAPLHDRLQRLATLHNTLATAHAEGRNGLESAEVLQEMGCERKALYRLAEDLRELGAPLEYSETTHVWHYRHTWNFPMPMVETLQGPVGIRLALDFLLDPTLERDLQGRIAIDPEIKRSAGATLPRLTGKFATQMLGPLARALRERRVVRFSYRKPSESSGKTRLAHPLELFEWDGMPYLQARDPDDLLSPIKRFALSRIDRLEVLEETFKSPPKRQIPSCLGAFCATVFDATIRADPPHAPYVRERQWHPKQKTRENADGSIEFTLPFGDYGEASRWILGRGPGFRPLAPERLVEAWKKAIRELAG